MRLFRRVCAVCTVLSVFTGSIQGDTTVVNSRIGSVTVYTDRARVTRQAQVGMRTGTHTLRFSDLPEAIDPGSIQISGAGDAVLHDVRLERIQLSENPDPRYRELEKQMEFFQDSLRKVTDRRGHAEKEKAFIQKIADGLAAPSGKEVPVELDPDKWIKMVAFYREKLESLDGEIFRADEQTSSINREIDRLQRELRELRGARAKNAHRVTATVDVRRASSMEFTLSYIVYGPTWSPRYDVRADSESRTLEVTCKADIRQATGEDWENVSLYLSTAQPRAGGDHPELQPWFVSFREAPQHSNRRMRKSLSAAALEIEDEVQAFSGYGGRLRDAAVEEKMAIATSTVETKATSVLFSPDGQLTVPGDNQPKTVTITEATFDAEYRYSTAPRLVPRAYLRAEVTNSSEYPLLAGTTHIFLDGAFVASGDIETVAPGEEFSVALGTDNAVAVEHKLIRRYEKKEGFITKKKTFAYEYRIIVTNKKNATVDLVLRDGIPVSTNEQIEIKLIEPEYREESESLKLDKQGMLEWHLTLEPGEEREIPLRFDVSHPPDTRLRGL